MFQICKQASVEFKSSADKKGKSVSIGSQTEVRSIDHKQVQSLLTTDKSIQVNLERCLSEGRASFNSDKLMKFLNYASDLTIKEIKESIAIEENLKYIDLMSKSDEELSPDFYYSSTKSNNFSDKKDRKIEDEKKLETNQTEKLTIEHLTFSCNLNQLIIGYSVRDHTYWCTHRSRIEFCNLYQTSDKRPNLLKTIFEIEIKNCITQLISHPTQFSKIAIGTKSGTIQIIDREQMKSSDADNYIKHESNLHKLEITFLSFKKSLESTTVASTDKNSLEFDELVSCSLDGKIILWKIKQLEKQLQVIRVFNMSKQSIKQVQSIRCAALSDRLLIIGCENYLFSTLISEKSPSNELDIDFEYEEHKGEIKSIELCSLNSNLFLTNGKDAEIRLYELNLRKPLYTIYLDKNCFNYKWINFRLVNEKFELNKQTSASNFLISLHETNLYIINIYKKDTKYFTNNQSFSLKETFQKLFINESNQLALVNSVDDVYLFDLNVLFR